MAISFKRTVQNVGLTCISLLLLFLILEIVFRLLGYSTYEFQKNDSDFIQQDSLLNYRFISHLDTTITTQNYQIFIQTNARGFRDDEWDFQPDTKKILVAGNSFSAGFGVEKQYRWSDQLQASLITNGHNYGVYNAAISGHGLQHMTTTARTLSPKVQPDIIILGVFLYGLNRIENPFVYYEGFSVRKNKLPFARIYEDDLYLLHFRNHTLQSIEIRLFRYSALYNFIIPRLKRLKDILNSTAVPKVHPQLKEAKRLLETYHRDMDSSKTHLLILPVIQHEKDQTFNPMLVNTYRELKAYCRTKNIAFVDLLPALQKKTEAGANLWINNDPHWNEEAHKIAADVLHPYIINPQTPGLGPGQP